MFIGMTTSTDGIYQRNNRVVGLSAVWGLVVAFKLQRKYGCDERFLVVVVVVTAAAPTHFSTQLSEKTISFEKCRSDSFVRTSLQQFPAYVAATVLIGLKSVAVTFV